MAVTQKTVMVPTNLSGSKFRLGVTVAQWHARPEEIIDEYAYWYSPALAEMGMDAWALIDGVDRHTNDDKYDVWFANSPRMMTVTGSFIIFVKPEHHALCVPEIAGLIEHKQ